MARRRAALRCVACRCRAATAEPKTARDSRTRSDQGSPQPGGAQSLALVAPAPCPRKEARRRTWPRLTPWPWPWTSADNYNTPRRPRWICNQLSCITIQTMLHYNYMNIHPSRKCTEKRKDGQPCQAWAVRTSNPGQCAPHGGGKTLVGAPPANSNAITHGVYASTDTPPTNLETRIADLDKRVRDLSTHIDILPKTTILADRISLLSLHGQLTSRLGRLMKDRQSLAETNVQGMEASLKESLAIASQILNADLLKKSTFPI